VSLARSASRRLAWRSRDAQQHLRHRRPVHRALHLDPSAAGATALGATFAPPTRPIGPATAATFNVIVGSPVQGTTPNPISLYVDTIVASGSTGVLAPEFGAGCEITSEFIVGQTIVFRVYGNDSALGGAVLTPLNVSTATVTIPGVATPLALSYGNHGGVAFWTAPCHGYDTGKYDTLGIINYKVTFNTIAVPAVTKKVTATKLVRCFVRAST